MNEKMELRCIAFMDSDRYKLWKIIKDGYKDLLNEGLLISSCAYTAHNYNNHCIDIYRIISKFLLIESPELNRNQDALLALNLAVLLHDISMTKIGFDRNMHQLESIKMIRTDHKTRGSVLSKLDGRILEDVIRIIRAHSDIKHLDGNTEDTMSSAINDKDTEDIIKVFCGVLRLADELDTCIDRINMKQFISFKQYVSECNEKNEMGDEELKRINESLYHWETCYFIEKIALNANSLQCIDIIVHKANYEESDDKENINMQLIKRQEKISKELEKVNAVFNRVNISNKVFTYYKKIEVLYDSQLLESIMTQVDDTGLKYPYNMVFPNSHIPIINSPPQNNQIEIISKETSLLIKNWVQTENLQISGHFKINEAVCARDWIEIDKIIEDNMKLSIIIAEFSRNIRTNYSGNIDARNLWLLGLDINGMIIASRVALQLHIPFTYMVHNPSCHSVQDMSLNIPENVNILLICDIITTLNSLEFAKKELEKNNSNIIGVYSVLDRMPSKANQRKKIEWINRIYTLNSDFPIETFEGDSCIIKANGKCLSMNSVTM